MFRMDGQVCIVTGCGSESGIGFAAARQLGEQGAKVILTATTERIYEREQQLKALGMDAQGMICNLLETEQVDKMVADIIQAYGQIHVLINNAGIGAMVDRRKNTEGNTHPLFEDLSAEAWEGGIRRNLMVNFHITRRLLPHMIRQNYGRLVHVSSVTGPVVTQEGLSAYSAAKAAIVGMSKAIALENGKYHITSNCVLPGWVDTGVLSEGGLKSACCTPAGRAGRPEEIAAGLTFLATPEASYITGQELVIDGGNVIQEAKGDVQVY